MDRRAFVRGLFGVTAAVGAAGMLIPTEAEAAVLPMATPEVPKAETERTESDYRPEVDGVPTSEKAQYYYRRRVYRRRRVYGRRRVYRRRRFARRVYYRRPVYYRPIYRRPYYF